MQTNVKQCDVLEGLTMMKTISSIGDTTGVCASVISGHGVYPPAVMRPQTKKGTPARARVPIRLGTGRYSSDPLSLSPRAVAYLLFTLGVRCAVFAQSFVPQVGL